MTRTEFLNELERLLDGLPEEERRAAVRYYEDYFADAGEEYEQDVLRELGSPEKVAASIRADYYGTEFREEDYDRKNFPARYGEQKQTRNAWSQAAGSGGGSAEKKNSETQSQEAWRKSGDRSAQAEEEGNTESPEVRTSRGVKILLIALIALAVVPAFWGGLAPVFWVVIGLLCTVVGIFAGLVVGAAALMLAGLGMVISAVPMIFDILPMAFLIGGIGLLLFVVGLVAVVGTVKLCMIVYPAMFRGFINLCRRPFYGKAV